MTVVSSLYQRFTKTVYNPIKSEQTNMKTMIFFFKFSFFIIQQIRNVILTSKGKDMIIKKFEFLMSQTGPFSIGFCLPFEFCATLRSAVGCCALAVHTNINNNNLCTAHSTPIVLAVHYTRFYSLHCA